MSKKVEGKPRVGGVVVLLFAKAILSGVMVWINIQEIQRVINDPNYIVESWALPLNYGILALAVASFVAAVLIARYKSAGLILGGIVIGLDLLLGLIGSMGTGNGNSLFSSPAFFLNLWALYYIVKYANGYPQNTYFS